MAPGMDMRLENGMRMVHYGVSHANQIVFVAVYIEQGKRRRIRRISNETDPQASYHHHDATNSQFVARVISLPVAQESLCATQSIASQFGLGRVMLDHTHTMLQRLTAHAQHNPTLHRSLLFLDDKACSLLDLVETNVPLIQQPTATIVHTLIGQPRQQIRATLCTGWSRVDGIKQRCSGWTSHRLSQAAHSIRSRFLGAS
jgi:hypothetical protein